MIFVGVMTGLWPLVLGIMVGLCVLASAAGSLS
jgi:hypothetical protein